MAIITLANYKTLSNTTDTTYDTFIEAVIPAIQEHIEKYCDRQFDLTTYNQWFYFNQYLEMPQYPITQMKFLGTPDRFAEVTFNSDLYTIEVKDDAIHVTSLDLTTTEYTFASYATIQLICDAITAATPAITFDIVADYVNVPCQRLRPGVVKAHLYGSKKIAVAYKVLEGGERILELSQDFSYSWTYSLDEAYSEVLNVIWQAGYSEANMPDGLQLIMANIITDIISNMTAGVNETALNPNITSEKLTNYSYNLGSISEVMAYLRKEWKRYEEALTPYMKKGII